MFSRLAQVTLVALGLTISNHANAAPLAYGTYYDDTFSPSCPAAPSCRVNFSQLPADKLLMVGKVNCVIGSTQPITDAFLEISATAGGSPLTTRLLPIAVPPSQLFGSQYVTTFREDTHYLIGNGRFPFVLINASATTTTGWSVTCTMIGELVTPIQ
jgi:hypothetical protein